MNRCIICNSSEFNPVLNRSQNLLRCKQCELIVYEKIKEVNPQKLYNKNYFQDKYYNYESERQISKKNFSKRIRTIRKYVINGNLLEVGCAYGFFMDEARRYFDVFGLDIADCGISYAREKLSLTNVLCGDYLDINYKSGFFDSICLFDTIEHLKDPHKYLKKAHKELKDSGTLFLTTGNIGSILAKVQKSKWRLIDPPLHLYYFSEKTIKLLLEGSGFKVIKILNEGYYRSLAFMLYAQFFGKKNRIVESSLFSYLQKIPIYLNLFDIMLVVAKKR